MIYIALIYALVVTLFFTYMKIGFIHIRKNASIADVTSHDFIATFRQVSIIIVVLTVLALIVEAVFIP